LLNYTHLASGTGILSEIVIAPVEAQIVLLCYGMDEQQRKLWIFERLKGSLQALALPAAAQLAYFPDFVVKTDELVLDFDHWRDCAVGNYHLDMTTAQLESLAAIDAHVAGPDACGDRSVWDESALYSHPFWKGLRKLAIQSLKEFDWPPEEPPSYAHEYVRS
jgi:hypothetical protein